MIKAEGGEDWSGAADQAAEMTNYGHTIVKVPTGCGKSWLLPFIGAYIRDELKIPVLIVTSNQYLSTYGQ